MTEINIHFPKLAGERVWRFWIGTMLFTCMLFLLSIAASLDAIVEIMKGAGQ